MNTETQNLIIEQIKTNRISTCEISDCLGKTGVLSNVTAINFGHFRVGPVRWVYAYQNSNWEVHKQLRHTKAGEVIVIETFECDQMAVIGDLVSKFTLLYRQAAAIVVLGYVRDVAHLRKENFAIWSQGTTPLGCYNKQNDTPLDSNIIQDRQQRYQNAIAVCDDSGVVIIPPNELVPEFMKKLSAIEEQEDQWFECIDRRKWDTFDTVCLKKYEGNS